MSDSIPEESASLQTLLQRRERLMGKAYRLFYQQPVHIVSGEGVWLYDSDGKRYLDVYNNVPHVGHCHPHVVEAICKQAKQLNTHTRYLHETGAGLRRKIDRAVSRRSRYRNVCLQRHRSQ